MTDVVLEACLERIARHCEASGQRVLRLMFHGGEPMLVGPRRFRRWLEKIEAELDSHLAVTFAIQTNGTLIDAEWAELFGEFNVELGVSLDGPREVNDRYRVDHVGRGSYAHVVSGLEMLRSYGVAHSILSVVQLGADGLATYKHFGDLEPKTINFLFPDFTHNDFPSEVTKNYGPHPVADFMIPVADAWFESGGESGDVPLLRNICRIILGGRSRSDMFGNAPLGFVFVEVDGEIEGLDVLRVDGEGIFATGLNVLRDDFKQLSTASEFNANAIIYGLPIPTGCRECVERDTCSGGYLPHRFSRARTFDNPSVWCADILVIFDHMRQLLGVDARETAMRRSVLKAMAAES